MHATDTRPTRQQSRQTNLRQYGVTTADQVRFADLEAGAEQDD